MIIEKHRQNPSACTFQESTAGAGMKTRFLLFLRLKNVRFAFFANFGSFKN
jgi:hypothetical protein